MKIKWCLFLFRPKTHCLTTNHLQTCLKELNAELHSFMITIGCMSKGYLELDTKEKPSSSLLLLFTPIEKEKPIGCMSKRCLELNTKEKPSSSLLLLFTSIEKEKPFYNKYIYIASFYCLYSITFVHVPLMLTISTTRPMRRISPKLFHYRASIPTKSLTKFLLYLGTNLHHHI